MCTDFRFLVRRLQYLYGAHDALIVNPFIFLFIHCFFVNFLGNEKYLIYQEDFHINNVQTKRLKDLQ